MQGFAFMMLRNPKWHIENDYMFAILSIIVTMLMASAIHPVFSKIMSSIKVLNQQKTNSL